MKAQLSTSCNGCWLAADAARYGNLNPLPRGAEPVLGALEGYVERPLALLRALRVQGRLVRDHFSYVVFPTAEVKPSLLIQQHQQPQTEKGWGAGMFTQTPPPPKGHVVESRRLRTCFFFRACALETFRLDIILLIIVCSWIPIYWYQ